MDRTRTPYAPFDGTMGLVPAVILAAGQSLRMGRVKALLPWPPHGRPCVIHVIEQLRDGGASAVAVVTGAHHDAIAAVVGDRATVVFNASHDAGQLGSLQAGLSWAFAGSAEWAIVTLVDVPGVAPTTIEMLLQAAASTTALIVRPTIGAEHGHPVLWHRNAWPLLRDAGDGGARQVVRGLAARGQVLDVPVDDDSVLRDIDTPAQYQAQVESQKSKVRSQK